MKASHGKKVAHATGPVSTASPHVALPPPTSMRVAIFIFARLFACQALRGRVLWVAAVVAACGLGLAVLASEGAIVGANRIVADFTLATLQLAGSGVAIAAAIGGFAGDASGRLGYTWLSRPVPRATLLLGRFLGLWAVLALYVLLVGTAGALSVRLFAGVLPQGYVLAAAMVIIELGVLLACALLLATLCTPPLAAAASVVVLAAGNFSPDLLAVAQSNGRAGLPMAVLYRLLPDFYHLSMRPWAAANAAPPTSLVGQACAYGLCYTAAAMGLAAWAYSRRAEL